MAGRTTESSMRKKYAKECVESTGNTKHNLLDSTERLGLATCLYQACMGAFRALCSPNPPDTSSEYRSSSPEEMSSLKQLLGRLHLWGESFNDGSLDKAVAQSDEMRNTVLELLCDIGSELWQSKFACSTSCFYPILYVS